MPGIQVSLVEAPDFAFSIDLQGGDITFLPGLEIWLAAFIKEAVLQPYVLPEGITIPLDSNAGRIEVILLFPFLMLVLNARSHRCL